MSIKHSTVTATQCKLHFGQMLEKALVAPVIIEKINRKVAVLISHQEYLRLIKFENEYWARCAKEAATEGFIGIENSEQLLGELYVNEATT